jgi:hypothetical protein
MKCPACKHDFRGNNQHSKCPQCGVTIDDAAVARDDSEIWSKSIREFNAWEDATKDNRAQQDDDENFYHKIQWTKDEINELRDRGQAPIVFNRVAKKLNYLFGMELENRTDPKCLPRTKAHDDDVRAATDALRYVHDAEDLPSVFSSCWEDLLRVGIMGVICQLQQQQQTEGMPQGRYEIDVRHIFWDRLFADPHSRRKDYSDAAFKGFFTWHDVDKAVEVYRNVPGVVENFEEILRAANDMGRWGGTTDDIPNMALWYDHDRNRIRTIEKYYEGPDGNWYVCHFTSGGLLARPQLTGYIDENGTHICPLVMDSCNVDRNGNRYGLIRNIKDPQSILNKSHSKTMHLLSMDRTIAEEGAVESPEEFQSERSRPDGFAIVNPDVLKDARIQTESGIQLAQSYVQVMQDAKSEIDSTGPDAPMIGAGATSGRQVQLQQSISSIEIRPFQERLHVMRKAIYRRIWLGIRQTWTDEQWLPLTDSSEENGYRFVGINRRITKGQRVQELVKAGVDPLNAFRIAEVPPELVQAGMQMLQQSIPPGTPPEAAMGQLVPLFLQHPESQQPFIAGNLSRLEMDIILDESPDTAIVQQEEVQDLTELFAAAINSPIIQQSSPQLIPGLIKMRIEAGSFRNKKRLLALIEPQQDPQAAKMQEMQQQLMQQMQQLQQQLLAAKVQETQASAALKGAQAMEAQAGAQLDQTRAGIEPGAAQADAALKISKAQVEPIKVQAEAQRDQATAVMHAVRAGQGMAGA